LRLRCPPVISGSTASPACRVERAASSAIRCSTQGKRLGSNIDLVGIDHALQLLRRRPLASHRPNTTTITTINPAVIAIGRLYVLVKRSFLVHFSFPKRRSARAK
jgi:hypothetical protein